MTKKGKMLKNILEFSFFTVTIIIANLIYFKYFGIPF